MSRSLFLRALAGDPVERFPVWMMRQAGRYLPGYRAVRERVSFLDLCRSAELAAEVSLEPVHAFDVDAAIVFADILLTADAMGVKVTFGDHGPKIETPIRTAAAARALRPPDASRVRPTMEAIKILRKGLPPTKAVLGFSAAPFTLVAYLVEGGSSRDFNHVRRFLHEDRPAFRALVTRAAEALVPYLAEQASAGADALQLFDTWGGILSPADYRSVVAPAVSQVVEGLGRGRPPMILFPGLSTSGVLSEAADTGVEALSVDWRTDLPAAYAQVGRRVRIQGNLDPAALYGSPEDIRAGVRAMLDGVPPGRAHIGNLGHGILPDIPVSHAAAFVSAVQAYVPKATP